MLHTRSRIIATLVVGVVMLGLGWKFRTVFPLEWRKTVKAELELLRVGWDLRSLSRRSGRWDGEEMWIAHAGGAVAGETYTNSREALELSYEAGIRFFEIDFSLTTDEHYVAIHDWEDSALRRLGSRGTRTKQEFLAAAREVSDLTAMTLEHVLRWLESHPDAVLVTDTKVENPALLRRVAESAPELLGQVVPQIYFFSEYPVALSLGYERTILTLYQNGYLDSSVLRFAKRYPVFAVTMSVTRSKHALPAHLGDGGTAAFVHTVDDERLRTELRAKGVGGFYVDDVVIENEPG